MKKLKNLLPNFLQDRKILVFAGLIMALYVTGLIMAYAYNTTIGLFMTLIFLIIIMLQISILYRFSTETNQFITDLSYRVNRSEQEALIKMPIGILIYNKNFEVQWVNPYLQNFIGNNSALHDKIKNLNPELNDFIQEDTNLESSKNKIINWNGQKFDVLVQKNLRVAYLLDVTHSIEVEQAYEAEKLVLGQVYIDNYSELIDSLDDKTASNISNYITNVLSEWGKKFNAYVKRLDDDHYLLVTYEASLKDIEKDSFSVLNVVREETSKQNTPLTLSMGIAFDEDNVNDLANAAQNNLNLALGRGGDQVVVKSGDKPAKFYGGKTNPMEKRTRVRSRFVSQALNDIIIKSDAVFVTGHAHPDMDSLGSCLGVARIAEMNGRQAFIVINQEELHTDVARLMEDIAKVPELAGKVITEDKALSIATEDSTYVMLDHSKPSITGAPELFKALSNRIVIIDHHRRGEEFPDNPMLVYIEPYSSSTSELVTEMFEYQPTNSKGLLKIEATALLAGIIVDTKSFSLRSGTRTFGAASYLRSVGADSFDIEQLLKENVGDYLRKTQLIESLEMATDHIGVCAGSNDIVYDSVIGAQAADTLLTLSEIDASFVITRQDQETIHISGRSLGDINVQVIMEKMGGGGHLSNAATQIKDQTIDEVKEKLINIVRETFPIDD